MYDSSWVIEALRGAGPTTTHTARSRALFRFTNAASTVTIAVVGLFTKVLAVCLNKVTIFNKNVMNDALQRSPERPLITFSNHHSCFDDPGLWGTIPAKYLCSRKRLRWSLAAHDICFTNVFHSVFFLLGKCIPVIRGKGVNQPAIDFCIEQLRKGSWVHIFPEGKVNLTKETMRLKWGIGRLIYESEVPPLVVPIWHEGMDEILPNYEPYYFRLNKRFYINYGNPIDVESLVANLRRKNASPEEARKQITDLLQAHLYKLKDETQKLVEDVKNKKKS